MRAAAINVYPRAVKVTSVATLVFCGCAAHVLATLNAITFFYLVEKVFHTPGLRRNESHRKKLNTRSEGKRNEKELRLTGRAARVCALKVLIYQFG